MIGDILQPTHLLFILVIALLVLGPKRLPEVGRALGRGLRDFRHALNTDDLRDQMISTTNTEGATPATPEPGESTETAFAGEPPTVVGHTDDPASPSHPEPTPPGESPPTPAASAVAPDHTQ